LAGWVKESKAGKKYFSLSAKPAEEKPAATTNGQRSTGGKGFNKTVDDDTIPF
jgi:hypothetical protein